MTATSRTDPRRRFTCVSVSRTDVPNAGGWRASATGKRGRGETSPRRSGSAAHTARDAGGTAPSSARAAGDARSTRAPAALRKRGPMQANKGESDRSAPRGPRLHVATEVVDFLLASTAAGNTAARVSLKAEVCPSCARPLLGASARLREVKVAGYVRRRQFDVVTSCKSPCAFTGDTDGRFTLDG